MLETVVFFKLLSYYPRLTRIRCGLEPALPFEKSGELAQVRKKQKKA